VDACILGRIGYDLYAVEHHRPLPEVEHFSRHLGGSSANIAVGLARLGLRVAIISCVGDDLLADYLLDVLRREGIDTRHVQRVRGYNTSLCLTEVCPPHSFRQVFYRRDPADAQVRVADDELASVRAARMFITNGTSLAASPSREATMTALQTARKSGLRTVLDVDYRASSWASPKHAGEAARAVLPWVEVLLGNEEELAILTGEESAARQVRAVREAGVPILVRKLGPRGVELHADQGSYSLSSYPGPVVSAIGGGDAFAAGFLWALHSGMPLDECLSYGSAAAAIVVSRVSCSDAMPYREELEQFLVERQAKPAR
jgi:5-dehydro-2-deoxygluconokinase